MKLHYPAQFACALLNAQPMGFYSPHTLVRDAVRHGVQVLGPDVNRSAARLHARGAHRRRRSRWASRDRAGTPTRRRTRCASGCATCAGLADALLDRIDDERDARGPFTDLEDFTRRTGAPVDTLEALATAGAFGSIDVEPARRALGRGCVARRRAPPAPGGGVGDAARRRHRGRGARAPRHDRGRGDGRRPVGHRTVGQPPPDRVRARRARGPGRRDRRGAAHAARPVGGGGGRGRHPPPAARDGQRRRVPQPRGRDRPRERDLHPRRLEALPQGGAHVARVCGSAACSNATRASSTSSPTASRRSPSASPTSSNPATSTDAFSRSWHVEPPYVRFCVPRMREDPSSCCASTWSG